MKAFTFFMATGLTILLFNKDFIVKGSTCLVSCDIGGVFCPSLCSLLKKTSTGKCIDGSSCPSDKPKECICVDI